jgi:hypothetical protein
MSLCFFFLSFARKVGLFSYGNCWYIEIPHLQAVYILFPFRLFISLYNIFNQKLLALYLIAYRRSKGYKAVQGEQKRERQKEMQRK